MIALVVVVSLTVTNGNSIDMMWKLMCSIKDDSAKVNHLRVCIDERFKQKAEWLPDAVTKCEYSKFPYGNFEEFVREMCRAEREADMKEVKECVSNDILKAGESLDESVSDTVKNCF
ncbi:uncharacterized protein LOC143227112 isoform X2 [Tachypleus tridentatus]|uniref:uncharacterized protein LOC143227112 isoform X2 n=1 Tax=Tachypleus tridentatus TaxID=6853 RepID=UPI003FD28BDA